jgi:hypothetical protein
MTTKQDKGKKQVVLGEGYLDHADARHNLMLWKKPLDADSRARVKFFNAYFLEGKKVRLIAEILP